MLIQFKKGSGKRLLSLFLVLTMLLSNLTGIVSATEPGVSTDGDISGYSSDPPGGSGDTSEELGDTSEELGDTSEELGDTSEELGDTSEELGDTSEESGDTSEESGDTSEESGDTSEESGDTSGDSGDISEESGDISGYTVDIQIFNYMYRSGQHGSNDIYSNAGVFPLSAATGFNYDITIGGIASDSSTRKPMAEHIKVELANLQAQKTMTINPVYPDAPTSYQTQLTVIADSYIKNLVLGNNAQATLDLKAHLTIGALSMGEGSLLTVKTESGKTLTLGSTTGDGTLQITGGKLVANSISVLNLHVDGTTTNITQSLHAKNDLRLSGTVVDIEGGKITAGKSINAANTRINGAALFGFDSDATGTVSLTYTDCIFNGVDLVGAAENCQAKVRFAEDSVIDAQNGVTYVRDYTINYQVDSDAVGTDWPRHYRVKFINGENTVMPGEIVLPQYAAPGYTYMGWKTTADSETVILSLTNQQSDLTLYPSTETVNINDQTINQNQEVYDNADTRKEEKETDLAASASGTEPDVSTDGDISGYSVDVQIFNYMYRSGQLGSDDIYSNEGVFPLSSATDFNYNITIGGVASESPEEGNVRKPMAEHIKVELANLQAKKTMTINPVYPDAATSYQTQLTVTAGSHIENLVLGNNAQATLDLKADLTIGTLSMGEGSRLTVNTESGKTLTLGSATGDGTLQITGGKLVSNSISVQNLTVDGTNLTMAQALHAKGELRLNNASVDIEGGKITAGKSINAANSQINGAALFGFDSDATGTVSLTYTNCTFNGVDLVGAAENCQAKVRFAENSVIDAQNSVIYVRDYTINYQVDSDAIGTDWPLHYRVKFINGENTVMPGEIVLPQYAAPGYTYMGWKTTADSKTVIQSLTNQQGDLTLYPSTEAANIKVFIDLMFNLEQEACDNADAWKEKYNKEITHDGKTTHACETEAILDSTITLDTPQRFGYIFRGWRLAGTETVLKDVTSFRVIYSQLTDKENNELRLEAVWEADKFPLYWVLDDIPLDSVEISIDGGETWTTPEVFMGAHSDYWVWENDTHKVMRSNQGAEIYYGESLTEYFARLNSDWKPFVLRDTRSGAAKEIFQSWYHDNQKLSVYESSTFDMNPDTGILGSGKQADFTWAEYQEAYLKGTVIKLSSLFGSSSYALTVDQAGDWSYQLNGGDIQSLSTGTLMITNGTKVTLIGAKNASFSNWAFESRNDINFTERYLGEDVVYYDFIMPACDVTATYQSSIGKKYIDIANGAITFAENVDVNNNGLLRDGFWHPAHLNGGKSAINQLDMLAMTPIAHDPQKGYFYVWDMQKPLYVTSDGVATTNQLTLLGSMTIYLKNCYLRALEDYSKDFVGYKYKGTFLDSSVNNIVSGDNSRYGNIILDSSVNSVYTTTLNFEGINHIAAIFQNNFKREKGYFSTLALNGSTGAELYLGCALVHAQMTFSDLKIQNYQNETYPDNLKYIVINLASSNSSGSPKFVRCNIDAEDQRILSGTYGQLTFTNTTARLNSFYTYGGFNAGGTSNLHFTGDIRTGYSDVGISGSANVVVDGSFIGGRHNTTTTTINTSGFVIVKGPYFDLANLTVTKGTVICNVLIPNLDLTVQGGTVIANHIANRPFSGHSYDTETADLIFAYNSTTATYQIDRGPFRVYSNEVTEPGVVTFTNGDVYLLGYHNASNGIYNDLLSAMDNANPLSNILKTVLDENGNILTNPSVNKDALIGEVNTNQECVLLGNTNYTTDSAYSRKVTIAGGNIYASGNVNFFNDVTMTSGTVTCNGAFSSSLSLTIRGGTVKAAEIGNAEALTVVENGTPRWMYTTITGNANLCVDRLGALSNNAYGDAEPRTTLQIVDYTGMISTWKASDVTYLHDVSVSYVYDKNAYPLEEREFGNLRFSGSALDSLRLVDDSLDPLEQLVIASPTQAQDAEAAIWRLNSLSGKVVSAVEPDGKLLRLSGNANAEVVGNANFPVEKLALYAARESANLVVKGHDNFTITEDGADKAVSDSILLKADSEIQIKLTDTAWLYKTIVCYYDANGVLHNINPKVDAEAGAISFVMPATDVELWISDSYTLYLNEYSIVFTSTGFIAGSEEFIYRGDIVVSQSNIYATRVPMDSEGYPTASSGRLQVQAKAGGSWYSVSNYNTLNTITFATGSGNADGEEFPRTITLEKIVQDTANYKLGTTIANGEDVTLTVRGAVMLAPIEVMRDSDFLLVAEISNATDIVCVNEAANNTSSGFDALAGTTSQSTIAQAGNITFKNLTLVMQHHTGHAGNKFIRSQSATTNCAKIENCILRTKYWGPYSGLIRRFANAEITGSTIALTTDGTYFSTPFDEVTNLVMRDTNYFACYGGSDSSSTLFANAKNVTLTNCTINQETVHSTTSPRYISMTTLGITQHIVIDGNTDMNIDHRIWIDGSLTVKDNGRLNVGTQTDLGYLLCPKITVLDSAVIDSDYIIVSGFFAPANKNNEAILKPELDKKIEDLVDILDGKNYSGLSISGNAQVIASEFVGGDVNGKITISGGVLDSKRIGTYGGLFGFTRRVPAEGEPFIYEYPDQIVTAGATVTISGGTVNVGEYLGGMNSTVNITGGEVNLAENAILGMTDAQMNTLSAHYKALGKNIADYKDKNISVNISGGAKVEGETGGINTPYGATNISGKETAIKLQDISAIYGDVTIRDSQGTYSVPGVGKNVGVWVSGTMIGQRINILEDAQVFARFAYADAPQENDVAELNVIGNLVTLHAEAYGSSGMGKVTITGEAGVNIKYTTRQYIITYMLNDDKVDPATNDGNPAEFIHSGEGKPVYLKAPVRHGYEFVEWYALSDDGTKVPLGYDGTNWFFYDSAQNDIVVYAGWKPLEVQFKIKVDTRKHYVGTTEELTSMDDKISLQDQIVTFTDTVSVPYLEQIFGTDGNGINLDNFAFPSYSIVKLVYGDEELTAATATVTKEILHDYTTQVNPEQPLVLWVNNVIKKNEHLVLKLNVGANGRPVGAAFQNNISGDTIFDNAAVGATLGSAKQLIVGNHLNQPTAPGYTFAGWNTRADGNGDPVDENYLVGGGNATTFYAKWVPNTYAIKFDSAGGQVTQDNNPPDKTAPQELTAYVTYDQKINGNISYTSGASEKKELPVAWKDSYHFKGWTIKDSNTTLTTEELNASTFNKLNLSSTDEVLTFEAVYSPVVVTYHTEGGTFTSGWIDKTGAKKVGNSWRTEAKDGVVGHGLPLAGYSECTAELKAAAGENTFKLSAEQPEDAGRQFAVVSTTAQYYQSNGNTYYPGDYRDDIGKKGYTFLGWNTKKDGSGEWVGTLPARTDIELYAQWAANSYTLRLNQGEFDEATQQPQSQYSKLLTETGGPQNGLTVSVTVGKEIDGVTYEDIRKNWSDRTQWYVTPKEELENAKEDKRYILGFTFDWLEPGAPSNNVNDTTTDFVQAYRTYAASVTALINNQALMTKKELIAETATEGSVFHLPSDDAYNNTKITGVNVVPDYPDRSEIPMYAVYRERSLVFIERYVDASGITHETVLHTAPVTVYSDYAESYINSDAKRAVENLGYKLIRWAVNDPQGHTNYVDSKTNYDGLRDQWQKDANNKGSYDINVYTVYAPQVAESITLTASTQPSAESAPPEIYSIPGSMAFDTMQYSIENKTEGLVIAANKDALARYNPEKTKAVAIFLEFIAPDGYVKDSLWLDGTADGTNVVIGGGWQIRMTLFHSRVISSKETLQFTMNMKFPNQKEQSIALDVNVALQPTEWTVRYTAKLPEDPSYLQITPNDFKEEVQDSKILTASDYHWIYGTALWSEGKVPEIEGYDRSVWTYNGEAYPDGNLPLASSNPIDVFMTYQAKEFAFVNNAAEKCEVDKGNGKIPYHTAIKITPKVDPAFIWVQYGDESYRLDLLKGKGYPFFATEENDVYTILMPDGNIKLEYDHTMELYLCNGTIDVTAESYTQNGETVMWPGNYRIWQAPGNIADLPTEHVLNLSGDLTKWNDGSVKYRTIELGKLNISTQNSIALAPGAQAVLQATDSIVAENILVPSVDAAKANLTLIGKGEQPVAVTLTPAVDCAAIGGTQDSGAITLENLKLEVDMPALTRASGIGPGVSPVNGLNAKGEKIQIIDCNLTINEKDSSIGEGVKGTWIGSKETAEVDLRGTIINDNGSIAQLTMLDAKTVRIDDCKIGDSAGNGRIENHIIRGDNIFIDNSEIYMISADYTVLRAGATIAVDSNWNNGDDASVISVVGSHQNADWHYGTMQIYRPESSVELWNDRFLELNNGDITITAEKVTQGEGAGVTHEYAGSYQLLNAFASDNVSDVTINGMSTGAYVAMVGDFTIGKLTVNADATLNLSTSTPIDGEVPQAIVTFETTSVAGTKTLTVNAGDEVMLKTAISCKGDYVQRGGKLLSTTKDFVVGGNLTLENVTANVQGNIGSNGLAGVTTVSLKNSTVTAGTIGAIGEQSALDANGNQKGTFTLVALDEDTVLTGILAQDHYRLHYNITDENFALKNMYTSLRSSSQYENGVQGVTTYTPAIPNVPHYIPTDSNSYFSNWYIVTEQEERIAVSNESVKGFEKHIELDAATIQYAKDTDPADGTKTLELYAWMKLNGKGTIINGRELNDVEFVEEQLVKTVPINTHGAWTARFDVEGAALTGAKYQFTFDQALPIDTKLTLRFGKTNPVYYYHIVGEENVTVVKEDDFILMGSNDTADLILDSEELLEHSLQLSADFADVAAPGGNVSLSVETGTTSYPIDSVSYTVQNAVVAATCEINGQNVSYSVAPNNDPRYNGKTIYLVAQLSQNGESVSVPYDAKITWNDSEGTWLGGDTAYFVLGNFTAMNDNAGWLLEGLDSGTYAITWRLTAAPAGTQNVFQDVLATSHAATFSVSEAVMPSLAVTLESVNEKTPVGSVLTGSEAYVLVFKYVTNMPAVQARLEKQTALKLYSEVDNSVAGTTVTIPAETGVYRVRFSLDGFGTTSSDWDDVYFSFVVR